MAGPSLLFVTGTPGTGKRAVGNYLQERHGFVHLDFDNLALRQRYLDSGKAGLRAEIAAAREAGRGLVVTWGAPSEIRGMRSVGLEPIWFDSDRGAACQPLFARDPRRASRFRFVDTFEPDGQFRPLEAVTTELLAPGPRARTRPARDLVAAAGRALPRQALAGAGSLTSRLRWRIAGGLALAAAGAAAGGGLVLGLQTGTSHPARVAVAAPVAHAARPKPVAKLPREGVLVSGRSLAGVQLGDTMATVRRLWGHNFTRCQGCKPAEWFYFFSDTDPVGAGVQFSGGRVVAVFTLGATLGWHTETGIRVGQVLENPTVGSKETGVWKSCSGYSAKSTKTNDDAVTSILTQGLSVYGFALTRPSVSPCH